ncbi:MAG: hypothetical protein OXFUSZZB_000363, partial [Candidatus Fervidibacter sp.]
MRPYLCVANYSLAVSYGEWVGSTSSRSSLAP